MGRLGKNGPNEIDVDELKQAGADPVPMEEHKTLTRSRKSVTMTSRDSLAFLRNYGRREAEESTVYTSTNARQLKDLQNSALGGWQQRSAFGGSIGDALASMTLGTTGVDTTGRPVLAKDCL